MNTLQPDLIAVEQARVHLRARNIEAMKYVFFYSGMVINCIVLLLALCNVAFMFEAANSQSRFGSVALALIITGFIIMNFWLKRTGRVIAASILLWIPAAPVIGYLGFSIIFIAASLAG